MLCIQDSDDDDEVGDDDLFPELLASYKKSQLALGLPENFKFHHQL